MTGAQFVCVSFSFHGAVKSLRVHGGWWSEVLTQCYCELPAVVNRLTCRLIHWNKSDRVLPPIRAGYKDAACCVNACQINISLSPSDFALCTWSTWRLEVGHFTRDIWNSDLDWNAAKEHVKSCFLMHHLLLDRWVLMSQNILERAWTLWFPASWLMLDILVWMKSFIIALSAVSEALTVDFKSMLGFLVPSKAVHPSPFGFWWVVKSWSCWCPTRT